MVSVVLSSASCWCYHCQRYIFWFPWCSGGTRGCISTPEASTRFDHPSLSIMLHIHKRAKLISLKGGHGGREWGKGKKNRRSAPATEAAAVALNTSNTERANRRHSYRAASRSGVSNFCRQASSCKTTMHPDDENENDELDAKMVVAGLLSSTPIEYEMEHVQDSVADSETTRGTTSNPQGLELKAPSQRITLSNPLQASFETLDGVVCMYKSRLQPCALSFARKAVEDSCGKGFGRKELANLIAIYPDAYKLTASSTAFGEGGYCDILIEMGSGGKDTSRRIGLINSGGSLLMRRKEEFRWGGVRDNLIDCVGYYS